jgi:hypothetical protein
METKLGIRQHAAKGATPYLREWLPRLRDDGMLHAGAVLDLNAGDGRNGMWARELLGFGAHLTMLDGAPDPGTNVRRWTASEMVPLTNGSVSLVLLQYLLMFLVESMQSHLLAEVNRVSALGTILVVELEDIKHKLRDVELDDVIVELNIRGCNGLVWVPVNKRKKRCVLQLVRKG